MSRESFSVGEIAIWVRPESRYYGERVRISRPLKARRIHDCRRPGSSVVAPCYAIEWLESDHGTPEHGQWLARPQHLRKLPPKQDWVKICSLTDLPREVTCA